MADAEAARLKGSKEMFKLNAFQKYYAILDYYSRKKLSKLDGDCRFEYHHIKPKSIFGENDNLIVVVPLSTHCYLHKLLVEYYASCTNEAIKMNYAFDVLKNRSKTTDEMLSIVDEFAKSCWFTRNKKNYSYLFSRYSINV